MEQIVKEIETAHQHLTDLREVRGVVAHWRYGPTPTCLFFLPLLHIELELYSQSPCGSRLLVLVKHLPFSLLVVGPDFALPSDPGGFPPATGREEAPKRPAFSSYSRAMTDLSPPVNVSLAWVRELVEKIKD
jgi:hypothetical protein